MSEAKIEASAPMRGDTILGVVACDERAEDSIPTVKEDMPFDTMHDTRLGVAKLDAIAEESTDMQWENT